MVLIQYTSLDFSVGLKFFLIKIWGKRARGLDSTQSKRGRVPAAVPQDGRMIPGSDASPHSSVQQ